MKPLFIDFEYYNSNEKYLELVCCSYLADGKMKSVWLHDDTKARFNLGSKLLHYIAEGYTFVSFAWTAEARSLLSLSIDPSKIQAVDLYLLYRQLANHYDKIEFGEHLVNGKVRRLFKPKKKEFGIKVVEEKKQDGTQMQYNLASCLYKFLKLQIDTDHKTAMRDLIIAGGPFSAEDKVAIMEYCESDVTHLPALFECMWKEWIGYVKRAESRSGVAFEQQLLAEQITMADYASATAKMESVGYPLDVEAARRLGDAVPFLLKTTQADINEKLRGVVPFPIFSWDKREKRFKRNEKEIQDYIAKEYGDSWEVWTEGGADGANKKPSLSEDALLAMGGTRHNYKATLVDQLTRFVLFQQSINGFRPKNISGLQEVTTKKQKNFWDSVGSDGRVRPYFGIYGAQSSRSQPAATGFVFLKSAMFRGLVAPKRGKVIVACDFGQQEFLVGALLSSDKKMIEAYRSGDVYVYFAKAVGAIPPEGTKKTHPDIRDRFKSSVLGMQYGMGAARLAAKITQDTGVITTKDEAQKIISLFTQTFSTFAEWKKQLLWSYRKAQEQGEPYTIKLPCGWRMLGDNDNMLSVANVPIQGFGADAMRLSVLEACRRGLIVVQTLHDALYIECDAGCWGEAADTLIAAMAWGFEEAVRLQFKGKLPTFYLNCRNDPCAWGPSLADGKAKTPAGVEVKTQTRYFDGRCYGKDGKLLPEVQVWADIVWPTEEEGELDV
jgi:hypothetical protein